MGSDKEKLDEKSCLGLTVGALLEVVESGSKNIEIAVMRRGQPLEFIDTDTITKLSAAVSTTHLPIQAMMADSLID
jgi:20S proteasome subunit alpha 4